MLIELSPAEIRFMQSRINDKFKNGNSVNETIEKIASGEWKVQRLPRIRVVKLKGFYYAFDNRRLYIYRVLHYRGLLKTIKVNLAPIRQFQPQKFSTKNNGKSVTVSRGVTLQHCEAENLWKTVTRDDNLLDDEESSYADDDPINDDEDRNTYLDDPRSYDDDDPRSSDVDQSSHDDDPSSCVDDQRRYNDDSSSYDGDDPRSYDDDDPHCYNDYQISYDDDDQRSYDDDSSSYDDDDPRCYDDDQNSNVDDPSCDDNDQRSYDDDQRNCDDDPSSYDDDDQRTCLDDQSSYDDDQRSYEDDASSYDDDGQRSYYDDASSYDNNPSSYDDDQRSYDDDPDSYVDDQRSYDDDDRRTCLDDQRRYDDDASSYDDDDQSSYDDDPNICGTNSSSYVDDLYFYTAKSKQDFDDKIWRGSNPISSCSFLSSAYKKTLENTSPSSLYRPRAQQNTLTSLMPSTCSLNPTSHICSDSWFAHISNRCYSVTEVQTKPSSTSLYNSSKSTSGDELQCSGRTTSNSCEKRNVSIMSSYIFSNLNSNGPGASGFSTQPRVFSYNGANSSSYGNVQERNRNNVSGFGNKTARDIGNAERKSKNHGICAIL